jgi:hypothetical protein
MRWLCESNPNQTRIKPKSNSNQTRKSIQLETCKNVQKPLTLTLSRCSLVDVRERKKVVLLLALHFVHRSQQWVRNGTRRAVMCSVRIEIHNPLH